MTCEKKVTSWLMFNRVVGRVVRVYWSAASPLNRLILKLKGVDLGSRITIVGAPIVTLVKNSRIEIRDNVALISKSSSTSLGVSRPIILRTLQPKAHISIGRDTGLSGTTICSAIGIMIGERCLIGADVLIADTDFHQLSPENRRYAPIPQATEADKIYIGDDVFVGAKSLILKGVSIGDGSVIGAGSVVTKDVDPNTIVAGNPARLIRKLM
jgi:acetyltransferase-like isoleucine patch superfamily enzyme